MCAFLWIENTFFYAFDMVSCTNTDFMEFISLYEIAFLVNNINIKPNYVKC